MAFRKSKLRSGSTRESTPEVTPVRQLSPTGPAKAPLARRRKTISTSNLGTTDVADLPRSSVCAKSPTAIDSQVQQVVGEVAGLIGLMGEAGLAELELETGRLNLVLRRHPRTEMIPSIDPGVAHRETMLSMPMPAVSTAIVQAAATQKPVVPPVSSSPNPDAAPAAAPAVRYHQLKTPIAGTFYQAPSPNSPPFVKEGDSIKVGQTLCIVEAMKLMNEIKADCDGTVVKSLIANATPVDKDTVLFWIDKV